MFKDDGTRVPFLVAKYRDQYRENEPKGPGYSLKMENSPELLLGPDEPKGSRSVRSLKKQHKRHTASGKHKSTIVTNSF